MSLNFPKTLKKFVIPFTVFKIDANILTFVFKKTDGSRSRNFMFCLTP